MTPPGPPKKIRHNFSSDDIEKGKFASMHSVTEKASCFGPAFDSQRRESSTERFAANIWYQFAHDFKIYRILGAGRVLEQVVPFSIQSNLTQRGEKR